MESLAIIGLVVIGFFLHAIIKEVLLDILDELRGRREGENGLLKAILAALKDK